MSCERPLDSVDLEALSAGETSGVDPEVREHAISCPDCGRRLELFRELEGWISELPPVEVGPEFAGRVERLRAFSKAEKRSPAVWWPPLAVFGVLLGGSAALLSVPMLTGAEQAGLFTAFFAALGAEWQTVLRLPGSVWAALPGSASALSDLVTSERRFAAFAILLLIPAGFSIARLWLRRSSPRLGLRRAASR